MYFDTSDNYLISRALQYWANYIETGDINLNIQDSKNCGYIIVKPLTDEQQNFILRLRSLANKKLVEK